LIAEPYEVGNSQVRF